MVIVGSNKMIFYDDVSEDKIAVYNKGIDKKARLGENMDYDERGEYTLSYRSGDLLYPKIDSYEPLKAEIQHFIDCIKGNEKCITGPEHARKVVRILQNAQCKYYNKNHPHEST
jgi:predicted dehydrogenase